MGAFAVVYDKTQQAIDPESIRQLQDTAAEIRSDLKTASFQSHHLYMMSLETGEPLISELREKTDANGKKLVAVADLRIDNKHELSRKYNVPEDTNPVDLLLEMYRQTGDDFVKELLGDFAFVIYDEAKDKLLSGRDHIGVRPCFYSDLPEAFVCSSDLDFMLATSYTSDEMDETMLASWFMRSIHLHPERLLYKHIRRLIPAHILTLQYQSTSLNPYFSWDDVRPLRFKNDEAYLEKTRELIEQTIRDRIAPTDTVGAHLSGGLDSSSLSILLNRELKKQNRPFEAFSWSPKPEGKEQENSEYPLIRDVCQQENITCNYTNTPVAKALQTLNENPARYSVAFPMEKQVRENAGKHNVIQLFSGWGGDEGIAFNGRAYFMELVRKGKFYTLIKETILHAREIHKNPLFVFYGQVLKHLPPLSWRNKSLYKTWDERKKAFKELEEYGVNTAYIQKLAEQNRHLEVPYNKTKSAHLTQKQLYENGHLAARCEDWAMRGLRDNINYVFPLLDQRVLSFALAIPSKYYFYKGWKRWIFRKSMADILPASATWRKNKTEPEQINYIKEIFRQAQKEQIQNIDVTKIPDLLPAKWITDKQKVIKFISSLNADIFSPRSQFLTNFLKISQTKEK